MTSCQNWRETVLLGNPAWMPYEIHVHKVNWVRFGQDVERVFLRHPKTWPDYRPGDYRRILAKPWGRKEDPTRDYVDDWGCVWRTAQPGYVGSVVAHPLESDEALARFVAPGADTYNGGQNAVDFNQAAEWLARDRAAGNRPRGSLDHGFFLLRLEYLRGFENLMCDFAAPSDDFVRLHRAVHELNMAAVQNWIRAGAESIGLPEDLGGQDRSLLGPKHFRRWALPCYRDLHGTAQKAGCLTYFHCDGNIMDISDQILEIHPNVFNPQDRANGVENLAKAFKGRFCMDLDFDRQHALPFGAPKEIEQTVEHEIKTLGSRRGGLMMKVEVRADVPPDNLDAVAGALEKYSTYWF
jgi:hypothetical protein